MYLFPPIGTVVGIPARKNVTNIKLLYAYWLELKLLYVQLSH